MLLNTYYRYHNHSTTWKSNGNVTVLFCLFLSDHLVPLKDSFLLCKWLPVTAPPLGTTWRGDDRQQFSSRPDSVWPVFSTFVNLKWNPAMCSNLKKKQCAHFHLLTMHR